jgi:predicted Zn-dependent protease
VIRVGGIAFALLALGACSFRLSESNPFKKTITVEGEKEIGAEFHEQMRQSGMLFTDPIVLSYVNDLGQHIVRVTEPQPFIYRFNIVEADSLNAFAVPGGYIYLHTAVIEQAGEVSELAGVLAHEIAHVRRRHIAKASENDWIAELATIAATVLSGGDPAATVLAQGINVSLKLQHIREHEADADLNGIDYMVEAGYDPEGMVRFFQRILAEHGPTPTEIPPYLFTHPALEERIPAARVTISRAGVPEGLRRFDQRLPGIQARMATILAPVAGGSGIHARPEFDRARTDPLLQDAREALEEGDLDRAQALLEEAEEIEPEDPRVPMRLAEVDEARDDPEAAVEHLQRALALDPTVPLVHYRLGLLHKRLGNRSQAVFHLEQAIVRFGEQSSARRRAQIEVRTLSFPVLESTTLGSSGRLSQEEKTHFRVGETVRWWGSVSRQFVNRNPLIVVQWIDPSGRTVQEDAVRMDPLGRLSATLETQDGPPGSWEVRVFVGDSEIDRRGFLLEEERPEGRPGT